MSMSSTWRESMLGGHALTPNNPNTPSSGAGSNADLPPREITVEHILNLAPGTPFVPFPSYSIRNLSTYDVTRIYHQHLVTGVPFVFTEFDNLNGWDSKLFSSLGLLQECPQEEIPIHNCLTGKSMKIRFRDLVDAPLPASQPSNIKSKANFSKDSFYAKDLECPRSWKTMLDNFLPEELRWGGKTDLFRWLPKNAQSEVTMVYLGCNGSFSGFHRCFGGTVSLNLLIETHDSHAVCFATDWDSREKFDAFMALQNRSSHCEWTNLDLDTLATADFPIYVCQQRAGDLVIYPPATAHQVWNLGTLSTKIVWNVLPPRAAAVALDYVLPAYNRECHPDIAHTRPAIACTAMQIAQSSDTDGIEESEFRLLYQLYTRLLDDDGIEGEPATEIRLTRTEGEIVSCDFCGIAIWNRHLRCSECKEFDICLDCFVKGRSCTHLTSYFWIEQFPRSLCSEVAVRLGSMIEGFVPTSKHPASSLATLANQLLKSKKQLNTRLCHMCRIDHCTWKGLCCQKCRAFFCYRSLYRHFDTQTTEVASQGPNWMCPKCDEVCNCRSCTFATPYKAKEKPSNGKRVKAIDQRGKNMGFTDNVFDQRRDTVGRATGAFRSGILPKKRKEAKDSTGGSSKKTTRDNSRVGSPISERHPSRLPGFPETPEHSPVYGGKIYPSVATIQQPTPTPDPRQPQQYFDPPQYQTPASQISSSDAVTTNTAKRKAPSGHEIMGDMQIERKRLVKFADEMSILGLESTKHKTLDLLRDLDNRIMGMRVKQEQAAVLIRKLRAEGYEDLAREAEEELMGVVR